jgi:hypothetical protein
MTGTLANLLPRINLANGGSSLADRGKVPRVVTLKSGQQNASSPVCSDFVTGFDPSTRKLPKWRRVSGNLGISPEVLSGEETSLQSVAQVTQFARRLKK